ncbi:MAG: 5-(carboxyamino)imidazole ribonucleotide synthase [Bacillaceae bacterium G1]|nr:5-(carboxyamino)imidazole ribonucleotide synthase [Bacillota bacterium]OJF18134.1 MAG: 5-(carboxyamino)imidazole ribonucleotide synthase [Bacillaceae bacterium G1]
MAQTSQYRIIQPGSTIGILGGGQLGRMMALAAREMGYRIACLDPQTDSPCGQVADFAYTGAFDDIETALEMAQHCDVITYEFENVDDAMVEALQQKHYLPQGKDILAITRHRIREKSTLASLGIPVAPFRPVQTLSQLNEALAELGTPAVLKTALGGYDGKGQAVIRTPEEAPAAWERLSALCPELILEQWIPFDKEISVIAARGTNGEVRCFPPAENIHQNGILRLSMAPARISPALQEEAERLARAIAEGMNVYGLIAVEMFVTQEERLLVNELAPRPHNSGHYTQEACVTSQFEQHVRAICGLPLGSARLMSPVVMLNLLGDEPEKVLQHWPVYPTEAKLHLYGKKEARPGRKMGHINVLAPSLEEALETVLLYAEKLSIPLPPVAKTETCHG